MSGVHVNVFLGEVVPTKWQNREAGRACTEVTDLELLARKSWCSKTPACKLRKVDDNWI